MRASTSRSASGSSVWAASPITGAAAPVAIQAVKPWRWPSRSRSASSEASLLSTRRTESSTPAPPTRATADAAAAASGAASIAIAPAGTRAVSAETVPCGLPVPTLRPRIRSPRPSAAAAAPRARSPGWSSSAAIARGTPPVAVRRPRGAT